MYSLKNGPARKGGTFLVSGVYSCGKNHEKNIYNFKGICYIIARPR